MLLETSYKVHICILRNSNLKSGGYLRPGWTSETDSNGRWPSETDDHLTLLQFLGNDSIFHDSCFNYTVLY